MCIRDSSLDELYRKQHIRSLLNEVAFAHVVLLEGASTPGKVAQIADVKELMPV